MSDTEIDDCKLNKNTKIPDVHYYNDDSDNELNDDLIKSTYNDDDVCKNDDDFIFDPYNPINIEITLSDVQSILSSYGLPPNVNNLNLYRRAFIHKSYVKRPLIENEILDIKVADKPNECMTLKTKSNERLEFLGDGVLECVTKYYLYRRFPKEDEGFMTEKKIALVKNEHIGKLAFEMGLSKWFVISKHAEEKNIRINPKKLGCLFEAFVGALFLDYNKIDIHDEDKWFDNMFVTGPGFQMAQIFIEHVFEKHVNWMNLIRNDDNFKNILQVKIQKTFKTTPTYLIINQDEENGYHMGLYLAVNIPVQNITPDKATIINSDIIDFSLLQKQLEENGSLFVRLSDGIHKIKKKAEQTACQIAIEKIK